MSVNDRLKRGALAGMLALPFVIAVNLSSFHLLHFAKGRWVDSLSQLVYGHPIKNTIELLLGFFAFFIFGGMIGALFTRFVVPTPGQGDYLFRGLGWSWAVWFSTYAVGQLFNVSTLDYVAWETAVTQLLGITGWGLIVGWLTRRWDEAYDHAHKPE